MVAFIVGVLLGGVIGVGAMAIICAGDDRE